MNHRVMTQALLKEAQNLRSKGLSKRKIAHYFYNAYGIKIGDKTIWENVYSTREVENAKRLLRVTVYKKRTKNICNPCPFCSKCMITEIKDRLIPLNYQIADRCITCYLRTINLTYMDLINVGIDKNR